MVVLFTTIASSLLLGTLAQDTDAAAAQENLHPIMTEVLFSVPPLEYGGDVNLDSMRNNTGDEFFELMNPHEVSINLEGYKITDADTSYDPAYEFTFPEFMLGPGEIVVVFNGFRSDEIPGADGNSQRAPTMKNPHFSDAWVFRINPERGWQSFTNEADYVLLSDPEGNPLEAVEWGDKRDNLPHTLNRRKIFSVNWDIIESVQRLGVSDEWYPQTEIDGTYCSPGKVPTKKLPARRDTD